MKNVWELSNAETYQVYLARSIHFVSSLLSKAQGSHNQGTDKGERI